MTVPLGLLFLRGSEVLEVPRVTFRLPTAPTPSSQLRLSSSHLLTPTHGSHHSLQDKNAL